MTVIEKDSSHGIDGHRNVSLFLVDMDDDSLFDAHEVLPEFQPHSLFSNMTEHELWQYLQTLVSGETIDIDRGMDLPDDQFTVEMAEEDEDEMVDDSDMEIDQVAFSSPSSIDEDDFDQSSFLMLPFCSLPYTTPPDTDEDD